MTPFPLVIAFGFLAPAMLGWLVVAAVPIAIHLWRGRRPTRVPWAATAFLESAVQTVRRRRRIRQWPLLLARTAMIALVVLAAARPYFGSQAPAALSESAPTIQILVLDDSFSMTAIDNGQTRFERAKGRAREIIESADAADRFILIRMAAEPRIVLETPSEKSTALESFSSLTTSQTVVDLPATFEAIESLLKKIRRDRLEPRQKEIVFLADLGRRGWQPAFKNARARKTFENLAKSLGTAAELTIVDIGRPNTINRAVVGLRAVPSSVTIGRPVDLLAQLAAFGPTKARTDQVDLFVDGVRVQQKKIVWDKTGQITFRHQFTRPGPHRVEVRLPADNLPLDDRRRLAVDVRDAIPLLCVDGRIDPTGPLASAADYLIRALFNVDVANDPRAAANAPVSGGFAGLPYEERFIGNATLNKSGQDQDPNQKTPPRLDLKRIAPTDLMTENLARFDLVLLVDVPRFTPEESVNLKKYVQRGGRLIVFLGPGVSLENYRTALGSLLPGRLGDVVDFPRTKEPGDTNGPTIDPLDYRHPITRPFRDHPTAGLLNLPVERYVRIDSIAPPARVVLATAAGDPLAIEQPSGDGRVVLIATSADLSWGAVPLWPSFVPLVREMVDYQLDDIADRHNRLVGQSISGPALSEKKLAQIRLPDGQVRPITVDDTNAASGSWRFDATNESGFYRLENQSDNKGNETGLFAVHVDPTESNLAKITVDEFSNNVLPGIRFDYVNLTTADNGHSVFKRVADDEGTLGRLLVLAVLALLLFETLWAWRFGLPSRRRRRDRS